LEKLLTIRFGLPFHTKKGKLTGALNPPVRMGSLEGFDIWVQLMPLDG